MRPQREVANPAVQRAAAPRSITSVGVTAFVLGAVAGVIIGVLLLSGRANAATPCVVASGTVEPAGSLLTRVCPTDSTDAPVAVTVRVATPRVAAHVAVGQDVTVGVDTPLATARGSVRVPAQVVLGTGPSPEPLHAVTAVAVRTARAVLARATVQSEPREPVPPGAPAPSPQPLPPATPRTLVPGTLAGTDAALYQAAAVSHGFDAPTATIREPVVMVFAPIYGGPGEPRGRAPPANDRPG